MDRERLLDELAAAQAATLLAEANQSAGRKLVVRTFSDRDLNFLKLLAQKLTHQSPAAIALLATTSPQPALVASRSYPLFRHRQRAFIPRHGGKGQRLCLR